MPVILAALWAKYAPAIIGAAVAALIIGGLSAGLVITRARLDTAKATILADKAAKATQDASIKELNDAIGDQNSAIEQMKAAGEKRAADAVAAGKASTAANADRTKQAYLLAEHSAVKPTDPGCSISGILAGDNDL